jgi:D-serine dehydratase
MAIKHSVPLEAGDLAALRRSFHKAMRDRHLDDSIKGFPFGVKALFSEISNMGWNLLRGDLPLPCAVLRASALRNNSTWMQDFLRSRGAVVAPHAKTTMSPQLIQLQLDDGAWGMTVATVHQLRTCLRIGVGRVILANQVAAVAEQAALFAALSEYPELELYCLADSLPIVEALEATGAQVGAARQLRILLEFGYPGGRTGCRSRAEALDVARAVNRSSHLQLAGIEAFEGLLVSTTRGEIAPIQDSVRVRSFLAAVADLFGTFAEARLFEVADPILTAGGSAADTIAARAIPIAVRVAFRAFGCRNRGAVSFSAAFPDSARGSSFAPKSAAHYRSNARPSLTGTCRPSVSPDRTHNKA